MSIRVPERFSKDEYRKLNQTLNKEAFAHYKSRVTDSYKKPRGSDEYLLKDGLSEELLAKLDFIFKRIGVKQFDSLEEIAGYFRMLLEEKKYILLFAYNGTGKTRLSAEFKTLGQTLLNEETGEKTADTLYYNAFTEDLFSWNNDLKNDTERLLRINSESRFFLGLKELEMDSRIRRFLHRYADFDFDIDYDEYEVRFHRDIRTSGGVQRIENIKVSRGEENIFIWCFFLAIVQLVTDKDIAYNWVKYIYIDDPISSLDDNHVVAVAGDLAKLMKDSDVRFVVSSHHTLFYNVLCNETKKPEQLFLQRAGKDETYILKDTGETPYFYHVALLQELKKAADAGELYTYHFNILRGILEKTASFHGYRNFSACLRKENDENSPVYARIVNLLSHGDYSVFEPRQMVEENKEYFRTILSNFIEDYKFNPDLFQPEQTQEGHG